MNRKCFSDKAYASGKKHDKSYCLAGPAEIEFLFMFIEARKLLVKTIVTAQYLGDLFKVHNTKIKVT